MLTVTDHDTALIVLECTAERVLIAARRDGVPANAAKRLLHLGEELSSHALAARLLVKSGASSESLQHLLERATALVDDEREHGALLL